MPMYTDGKKLKALYWGSTAIARVYHGEAQVFPTPPPPANPVAIRQFTSSAADFTNVFYYNLPQLAEIGNWIVMVASSQEAAPSPGSYTGYTPWTLLVRGNDDGVTTMSVWAKRVNNEKDREVYYESFSPSSRRAMQFAFEVSGIDPAATSLPGEFWAHQGYMSDADTSDTVTANDTLMVGVQIGTDQFSNVNLNNPSEMTVLNTNVSTNANRRGQLLSRSSAPAGFALTSPVMGGGSAASSYAMLHIRPS